MRRFAWYSLLLALLLVGGLAIDDTPAVQVLHVRRPYGKRKVDGLCIQTVDLYADFSLRCRWLRVDVYILAAHNQQA